ncbi:CsbD family protein [Qipengyuania sphaerica]|uniref:CsbD family protein n=1 Tax=Qipengyuania sphaerica TaxID=2867243 RepID=UPI001C8AFE94|nr:CsbD family protein [Qipengyuania sphaerica]MBX7541935.1 CsbD family protein [Qipengyuania sphaerica]
MGELTEKIKGNANEMSGNTKQAVAEMTDDASLHQEGERQERKGEAQQFKGEIEGELGNDI